MKNQIIRSLVVFAALLLGLTAIAPAKDNCACSLSGIAGDWGYTETGTIILPTGPVLFAAIGKVTLDSGGNLTGKQESSTGGKAASEILGGSVTVNPDCTGLATVEVSDQAGVLLRTVGIAVVFTDTEREFRGVVTSLTLPSGPSLPTVITLSAEKTCTRPVMWHGWFADERAPEE